MVIFHIGSLARSMISFKLSQFIVLENRVGQDIEIMSNQKVGHLLKTN